MQNFPCPNPACRYVFDASMLPPAAMVTCPLCATRFPYRAGHPVGLPSPASSPALSRPVASQPQPQPAAEENEFSSTIPSREPPVVRRRVQASGGGTPTWLIVAIFAAFLIGVVFVVTNMMRNRGIHNSNTQPTVKDNRKIVEEVNLIIDVKDKDWKQNDDWTKKLGALIVYKKGDAEVYAGVYAEDFRDRNPRSVELRKMMEKKLYQGFDRDKLEMQDRAGEVTWGGKSSQGVIFQGTPKESDTIFKGECVYTSNRGVGYVFFGFATLEEFANQEAALTETRKAFAFGNLRDNWKEKVANAFTFASKDGQFQLQDRDGIWIDRGLDEDGKPRSPKAVQFAVDPKELDPKAVMAFIAELDRKKTMDARLDFTPSCEAMVLELDKGAGEPLERAKNYILERYQKEADRNKVEGTEPAKMRLDPLLKSPSESEIPKDGAPIARFTALDSSNPSFQKLVVISAREVDDKLVVVFGESSIKNGMHMEPYMLRLASSLSRK